MDIVGYINSMDLNKLTQIISGLATVAVLSMDLSSPYTKNELKIYASKAFQLLAIFSVVYQTSQEINSTLIITGLWAVIKYSNLSKFLN